MNRQQSEHILDAYVYLKMCGDNEEAANALREVIIDAMAEYRLSTITVPGTYPQPQPNYVKPIVTCEVNG